jgi:hypothetical protein
LTKKLLYSFAFLSIIIIILSFYYLKPKESSSIIVQFVTCNGYGNNLYIDNVSFGNRSDTDIAVTSINNIPRDTTYFNVTYSYMIVPQVNVTNLGNSAIVDSSATVVLLINSVQYKKIDTLVVSSGGTKTVTFPDSIEFQAGNTYNISAYVVRENGDTTQSNDTLHQTSVFLPGASRNVLVEEFTSTTSPSCASNNPSLNSYINTNIQNICAVKYHLGYPITSCIDSMYLADSIQQNQRANYYYIYSVPSTFLDGKLRVPLPYSTDSNLSVPFNTRFSIGSPLSVTVSDSLLTGDTIQATINVYFHHTLGAKNLRLRVYAIERKKIYSTAPGSNEETDFYDIFRQAYPDSAGTLISNEYGQYQYIFKYHRDSTWVDSLIYTLAFVQNDDTKEVLNCGKSRQNVKFYKSDRIVKSDKICYKADLKNNIPVIYKKNIIKSKDAIKDTTTNYFNFEGFEGQFPPAGWSILNPDVAFTFEQLSGYNGPTLGGIHCIKVPFYDYPSVGQRDTLLSLTFKNVTASDTFKFDYSYAQYLSSYTDSLIVNMSTDGGQTFTTIFEEGGYYLSTAAATTLSYAPTSSTQWYTYYYPMSEILTLSPVKPAPETYKLYQNYPNPFNPKTNIKFDLPNNAFVSIKIYDILGREIKNLVNEKMSAGSHTIEFTASNFASGIYFYRIIAGSYTEVKKMALIK